MKTPLNHIFSTFPQCPFSMTFKPRKNRVGSARFAERGCNTSGRLSDFGALGSEVL
jgi:hypothetical protein